MKKIFFSLMAIFLLVGCNGSSNLTQLTYNQFAEKVKEKESFVIFVESSQCSHCEEFKPTLSKVMKDYDLEVSYIDVSRVTEAQYKEIENKVDLTGTPTMAYIDEGNCDTDKNLIGNSTYENTVDFFKNIGYIN